MSLSADIPHALDAAPRRIRWWHLGLAAAVSGLLIFAATAVAGGLSDAWGALRDADGWWLALGVGAVAARFVFLGMQLRHLRGDDEQPATGLATRVSLLAFGLGGLLPASPAEGIAMSVVELRRRGMAARRSTVMLVASQWVQFWSLIIVFAVDRMIVVVGGEVHRRHNGRAVVVSLLLLGLVAGAAVLSRREAIAKRLALSTRWFPGQRRKTRDQLISEGVALQNDLRTSLGSPGNRVAVAALTIGAWLLDATVLWCGLRATHTPVTFEVAVFAYSIAIAVAWVPLLPSGLGLVELAVPAVLHRFGVPLASGLAAILLWRAVSLFLPALAGILAYVSLRTGRAEGLRSRS